MKLNRFKAELLRKEFGFLSYFDGKDRPKLEEFDTVKVARVDQNLLSSTPWEDEYSWSGGGHLDYERAAVVTSSKVIALNSACSWATGSGDRGETKAEIIGAQIRALNIRPDFIIVWTRSGLDDNENGVLERHLTIYKNKGDVLSRHMKAQLRRAYKELMTEIEGADSQ